MARNDIDPVPQQLVRADNESGQAAVPVTVSVHGIMLNGALVAQRRYFSEFVKVAEGLWRISLEAIDGWALEAAAGSEADRGPFARLLGNL